MPDSPVALDVAQPVDVLLQLAAKRTFDDVVPLQQGRQPAELVFRQIARLALRIDARLVAQARGTTFRPTPYKYVKEMNVGLSFGISTPSKRGILVRSYLTLTLLVPGIGADHVDPPCAADNFAVFANSSDARSNLHR